jgi:hypothetical protein
MMGRRPVEDLSLDGLTSVAFTDMAVSVAPEESLGNPSLSEVGALDASRSKSSAYLIVSFRWPSAAHALGYQAEYGDR